MKNSENDPKNDKNDDKMVENGDFWTLKVYMKALLSPCQDLPKHQNEMKNEQIFPLAIKLCTCF